MNILFLTSIDSPELQRLFSAAQKLGLTYTHMLAEDLAIDLPQQKFSNAIKHQLEQADAILTRMATTQDEKHGNQLRENLLHLSPELEHKVLNGKSYKNYPNFSKLLQLVVLDQHNVPIPTTYFRWTYDNVQLPVVVKALHGSNGQQVHYAQTSEELERYTSLYGSGNFIVQEPLPIGEDYRVIILGGEILGMHKKISTTGFATNVSAGGRVVEAEPDRREAIGKVAQAAAAALDCEYAGVDVMYNKEGVPVILEVNRAAGFNDAQEAIWRINLAEKLLTYLSEKR